MIASIPEPRILTFLTTYRCTAACKDCCFESSPHVRGRLSLESIVSAIDEAKASFPDLSLVVFTGGEAFLLKDDLYAAISHSSSCGLLTRVVTNGFWGGSPERARSTAKRLKSVGLIEANISTGKDHQEWVAPDAVIRASLALVAEGIRTLVTVEVDAEGSACYETITSDPDFLAEVSKPKSMLSIQQNAWMPFHSNSSLRGLERRPDIFKGCDQLFSNIVVTPYGQISACCGLTQEHT